MTAMVNDKNFDAEVLKSTQPVLVDFYAEWCPPCKAMAPALEKVAQEMKAVVKIVKLDVDASPQTTQKYNIQAMPTMIMFKGGKPAATQVGALIQKSQLETWIKKQLGAGA
ncbi:MAG TPA: thioredoxin [Hyphomicrobiaceae bacterium]|nr:thioredoxin [Hyphomicrobiaceae bacterium]